MQNNSSRLTLSPGLFRLCLAVAVMVSHSMPFKFGSAAVYLFFTLSGFWIHRMWRNEYMKTTSPYVVFIVSRLWRLMPVYLFALALFAVVSISLQSNPIRIGGSAAKDLHFYASNLLIVGLTRLPISERVVPQAWSLDIEMQFYFLAPILIIWMHSLRGQIIFGILAAISTFSAIILLLNFEDTRAVMGYMPMYMIFFLVGMGGARFKWSPQKRTIYCSIGATILFVIVCLARHDTRGLFLEGHFTTAFSRFNPAACFILALFLSPYAIATVNVNMKHRSGLLARTDRDLSNITYEVYLLHLIVFAAFSNYTSHFNNYQKIPLNFAEYAVTIALSWAVYLLFDRPIDASRRKFVRNAIMKGNETSTNTFTPLTR